MDTSIDTQLEPPVNDPVPTAPDHHTKNTLLTIGLVLIITALSIIVSSSWSYLGQGSKIALVTIPNIVLFAIAAMTRDKQANQKAHESTLELSILLFPFSIGTILFQLGIYPEPDGVLLAICSALGWGPALFFELAWQRPRLAPLAIFMPAVLLLSLLDLWGLTLSASLWISAVVGFAYALIWLLVAARKPEHYQTHVLAGGSLGLILLPLAGYNTLAVDLEMNWKISLINISLLGILYQVTWFVVRQYRDRAEKLVDLLNHAAGFIFLVPYAILSSNGEGYALVAFLLGFGGVVASLYWPLTGALVFGLVTLTIGLVTLTFSTSLGFVWLALILGLVLMISNIFIALRPLGYIGGGILVLTMFNLTNALFANSIGWPLTLLMVGLGLVGISLFIRAVPRWQSGRQRLAPQATFNDSLHGSSILNLNRNIGCLPALVIIVLFIILLANLYTFYLS